VLSTIRTASVKKVLSELKSIATDKPDEYVKFIEEYNRPLKEGLYSDFANRETLLELVRVKSTKVDGWTSLAEVKTRMKEGQKGIYFITGGTADVLRSLAAARNLPEEGHRGAHPRRRVRRDRFFGASISIRTSSSRR
jgi:molecular chaperone HtpG